MLRRVVKILYKVLSRPVDDVLTTGEIGNVKDTRDLEVTSLKPRD